MTTHETLLKYVSDMYALEEHLAQPLKSQVDDKDFERYPIAHALVRSMLTRTDEAMVELEAAAKGLGGKARGTFKAAITTVAGVAAAVINEGRTHPITKKLRDDSAALSLAALGYELLHATANALGSPEVAVVAQNQLHRVAREGCF